MNCNCDDDKPIVFEVPSPEVVIGGIDSTDIQNHIKGYNVSAMKPKGDSVASIQTKDGKHIGISGVIRWGDVITAYGEDIDISKAVLLGIKHKIPIAEVLKKDLKSKDGLLVTFPIAQLLNDLKSKVGGGRDLLKKLKV